MPRKYSFTNPEFNGVPAQTTKFNIPEEGEIFNVGGKDTPVLGTIKNNRLVTIDPNKYLTENPDLFSGQQFANYGQESSAVYNKLIETLGIKDIPEYNSADLNTVFNQDRKYGSMGERITDTSVFQNLKTDPTKQAPLMQGKAYKDPNSANIYQQTDKGLQLIKNEEDFKKLYGGLPEEGTNFQTLPGSLDQFQTGDDFEFTPEAEASMAKKVGIQTELEKAILAGNENVANYIQSGQPMTEEQAQEYALYKGINNYQQFIGGVGGQANPNYIGSTKWASLQKIYTPYQIQQATTRVGGNIYWKPNVNIDDVPTRDPNETFNEDANKIIDIVKKGTSEADKETSNKTKNEKYAEEKEDEKTPTESKNDILAQITDDGFGKTAEEIYKELFETKEISDATKTVNDKKAEIDEYDQQLEELKNDIRGEVEGEASQSYINALASVRGGDILKLKRSAQRDYDTALAELNGLKESAKNLLTVRVQDENTQYNRLFQQLQFQLQAEGQEFNQAVALTNIAMKLPAGRTIGLPDGTTVKGMNTTDNLNVVQFTDASGKTYVIGVDKGTGKEKYRSFIGQSKVAGSTTKTVTLDQAKYWLGLVKDIDKDGNTSYNIGAIPSDIREGVVNVMSQNPTEISAETGKSENWWKRQLKDVGGFLNPFD